MISVDQLLIVSISINPTCQRLSIQRILKYGDSRMARQSRLHVLASEIQMAQEIPSDIIEHETTINIAYEDRRE